MSDERRGWPYEPVDGPPPPLPPAPPLEEPPPPPPPLPAVSRRAVVLLAVAGSVAVLLATFGVGDWWMRNRELRTLLERVERAERAQWPAIRGISPLVLLCQQAAAVDAEELCDTAAIREGAERVLPQLERTGEEVADTRLVSFHGSLRTFRDRYVDHNLAWRSWIESLAQDPTAGGFQTPRSIDTTFYAASDAADEALTPFPLHGNRERVETIFASVR